MESEQNQRYPHYHRPNKTDKQETGKCRQHHHHWLAEFRTLDSVANLPEFKFKDMLCVVLQIKIIGIVDGQEVPVWTK